MELKQKIQGFTVEEISAVDELKATAYFLRHDKTEAQLLWLKRDDDNKTFSISFKTTPTDDTGVFHILEHSVLNGSRKYPVKEPFVDLLKGSLQTFLNAMTFPDKTMYPVSSRNNKDFINLMRVYLDAVFYPQCVINPNIFYQEGWHYQLDSIDGDIDYKGVVYNEMKGAYSSSESLSSRTLLQKLFPDNCYHFSSGGNPESIPDLSYEMFVQAHKKYYNATNAQIFLDGNIDLEEVLAVIDKEYLSEITKSERIEIIHQNPVINEPVRQYFESTSLQDKAIANYGYVLGDYSEAEKIMAFNVLGAVLCENNQSILVKALLDKELAQDVNFGVENSVYQPYLEIMVTNTNEDKFEEITKTINETFQKVVDEGVNKEELLAVLNKMEFNAKERDFGSYPKGIVFAMQTANSWLYGGNPIDGIVVNDLFASLKEKVKTDYFERLIEDYILNTNHCATVFSIPSTTLQQENYEAHLKKMADYKASLSKKELENLVKFNSDFALWQKRTDTPQQKATLPKLSLEDIDSEPVKIANNLETVDGITTITYPDNTEGIDYINMYFNIADLSLKQLQQLALIGSWIGHLSTEKHTTNQLNILRKNYVGSLGFDISFISNAQNDDYSSNFVVSFSCLKENRTKAIEIVDELINETLFDEMDEMNNLVNQAKNEMEMDFTYSGHQYALSRVSAAISEMSNCKEYIGGYEYYNFIKPLCDNLTPEFVDELKQLYNTIFTSNRLTVSVMGDDSIDSAAEVIRIVKKGQGTIEQVTRGNLGKVNEGIMIASKVSYALQSRKAPIDLKTIKGKMSVIGKILSLDYLWQTIRAMGGAYGSGFVCRDNMISYYSYRDPNPAGSLDAYDKTNEYLRQLCDSEVSLDEYIIGTIGDSDPVFTNRTKMMAGDGLYFSKTEYKDRQANRKQILSMDKQQIRELIEVFATDCPKNVCVVGSKEALETCNKDIEIIREL